MKKISIKVCGEHGYEHALHGVGLSYGTTDFESYGEVVDALQVCNHPLKSVAQRLAGKGRGHDKFLRHILVELLIVAPRNYWQEMSTYQVGVIPSQSESTMHTLLKNDSLTENQFLFDDSGDKEKEIDNFTTRYLELINDVLQYDFLHKTTHTRDYLAESWLQARSLTMSYAAIDNMLIQRRNHKLNVGGIYVWRELCLSLYRQLQHKEFLSVVEYDGKLILKSDLVKFENMQSQDGLWSRIKRAITILRGKSKC